MLFFGNKVLPTAAAFLAFAFVVSTFVAPAFLVTQFSSQQGRRLSKT
jgi:hypothetical protein